MVRGWLPQDNSHQIVDTQHNFIEEAPYEQEDIPKQVVGESLETVLAYCNERAKDLEAAGYFFQTHRNGHEIVGFFKSAELLLVGRRAWHGHARGCIVSLDKSVASRVDFSVNFIEGATYAQEDVPAHIRGLPFEALIQHCRARVTTLGAAGAFFQTHGNGHEVLGIYATPSVMQGQRTWHDHMRGFVLTAA